MKNFRLAIQATFYHTLELATCIVAAIVIMRHFELSTDQMAVVAGVAVDALVKFCRAHPGIPVEDFTRPKIDGGSSPG